MASQDCDDGKKALLYLASTGISLFGGAFVLIVAKLVYWLTKKAVKKTKQSVYQRFNQISKKNMQQIVVSGEAHSLEYQQQIVRCRAKKREAKTAQQKTGGITISPVQESLSFRIKEMAKSITNTENLSGKIIYILHMTLSLVSLGIYIWEAEKQPVLLERCYTLHEENLLLVDLACNTFFLMNFILNFITTPNKLLFWVSPYSIVDHFTVPPMLVSVILGRTWLGLRFLRALFVMSLPDVLSFFNILASSQGLRMCHLSTGLLGMWLSGSGAFMLLENTGDPWPSVNYTNAQNIAYGEAVYFSIVTMSTVGYGDIYPKTTMGRIFVVLFILFALAIFASFIPEIAVMLMSRSIYSGVYSKDKGKPHVVVCGNINYETASNFLTDFLHEDRADSTEDVVFINPMEPSYEMGSLLKRHFTRVKYFTGTVMNIYDMQRVQLETASACIVVANKHAENPDDEDCANIMRVISVKNYNASTRCIIQLLNFHNKPYLINIPSWSMDYVGDEILCLSEFKMGFMAQTCIAPGFSTLLSNLFSMRSLTMNNDGMESFVEFPWREMYLNGAAMEIYRESLSPAFYGLSFTEAALICYQNLGIILLAVESPANKQSRIRLKSETEENESEENVNQDERNFSGAEYLRICPGRGYTIVPDSYGIVLCDSQDNARCILQYCTKCHKDVRLSQLDCKLPNCYCRNKGMDPISLVNIGLNETVINLDTKVTPVCTPLDYSNETSFIDDTSNDAETLIVTNKKSTMIQVKPAPFVSQTLPSKKQTSQQTLNTSMNKINTNYDASGLFHYCHAQSINDCLIKDDNIDTELFSTIKDHVIMCVFSDSTSSKVMLHNFVMPLRASYFTYDELKPIILVGEVSFFEKEWSDICNFPKLHILPKSPMKRVALRSINIQHCALCIIISAKTNSPHAIDHYLADKEAILCTLNIKSMSFDKNRGYLKFLLPKLRSMKDDILSADMIAHREHIPPSPHNVVSLLASKVTPLAIQPCLEPGDMTLLGNLTGAGIPVLTELINDENIQYLETDDTDPAGIQMFLTPQFAMGVAFTASLLDSMVSLTYFNFRAPSIIRTLVNGSPNHDLEEIFAEGSGLLPGDPLNADSLQRARRRIRIQQVSLLNTRFAALLKSTGENLPTFGELFTYALAKYDMICLGIYRFLDATHDELYGKNPWEMKTQRVVITTPPDNFQLMRTDLIYCIYLFDPEEPTLASQEPIL